MSIKYSVKGKITRDAGCRYPALLKAVEEMDEKAAQELWYFLQDVESNASRSGNRLGALYPWR